MAPLQAVLSRSPRADGPLIRTAYHVDIVLQEHDAPNNTLMPLKCIFMDISMGDAFPTI